MLVQFKASIVQAPVRLASLTTRVAPPLLAFLLGRLVLGFAARSAGYKSTLAETWMRWDSAHYLSIATSGYELFSCARLPGYNPEDWCGNTAWLPGYPLLIRVLSRIAFTPEQSGVLIAAGFAFASLALLWNAFLGPELSLRGLLALALASLFPGHVYYYAVFPISMCTFFLILALKLYLSERFLAAGMAGACAAFTYSSGFFVAGVLGLHFLLFQFQRRHELRRQAISLLEVSVLTFCGFVGALAVQRFAVGAWNAFSLVQAKYHYALTPPWRPILNQLTEAFSEGGALARQATFFAGLMILLLWATIRAPRRDTDSVFAIFALTYWLVPVMLGPGYVAVVRAESMLLPVVPLFPKLPVPVLISLIVVALLLALRIDPLFFTTQLV